MWYDRVLYIKYRRHNMNEIEWIWCNNVHFSSIVILVLYLTVCFADQMFVEIGSTYHESWADAAGFVYPVHKNTRVIPCSEVPAIKIKGVPKIITTSVAQCCRHCRGDMWSPRNPVHSVCKLPGHSIGWDFIFWSAILVGRKGLQSTGHLPQIHLEFHSDPNWTQIYLDTAHIHNVNHLQQYDAVRAVLLSLLDFPLCFSICLDKVFQAHAEDEEAQQAANLWAKQSQAHAKANLLKTKTLRRLRVSSLAPQLFTSNNEQTILWDVNYPFLDG